MYSIRRHLRSRSHRVRPLGLAALVFGLAAMAAAPVRAQASADESGPFAPFEELIGEWMLDPASEFVQSAPPERQETLLGMIGLAFEWGPNRHAVVIREVYPMDAPERAEGYGIVVWDPVRQLHVFTATNTLRDFYFDGTFQLLEDGALRRFYEVYYSADRAQIPGDERPGWTRRFRDTYRVSGDTMEQRVEIFWQGAWRPWGSSDGIYPLRRRSMAGAGEETVPG